MTDSFAPPEPRSPEGLESARESDADAARERYLAALPGVLAQLGEGFEGSSNLLELLRTAGRHSRKLVNCEVARIWLARRGGRRLVARDFPETGDPVVHRIAPDQGLAGWVFTEKRSLRLADGEPRPAFRGSVVPFRSCLVLPLSRRGEVFAVLECLDRRGAKGFTNTDVDRLEIASEHIAFALDNALLYEETERRALEKEVLLEIGKSLSASLELDELLDTFLRTLQQVVDYDAASIYLLNRKTHALENVRAVGFPVESREALSTRVGQGIVGWVAKAGEPVIVPDVRRDPRYLEARPTSRSEVAAPLLLGGRTIGVFNLESDLEDAYHEGHLELLMAFAAQAAVALERGQITRELFERRYLEKELAIAHEIQASFLPTEAPQFPGLELAGAAQSHREVGGDYYDFIPVGENRLGLAIADVSGKGIPAALIMAGFRMSLLAEVRNEFAIRAVMRKVNSLLYESTERGRFVTCFYGVLDVKNRALNFSNAGHNPPLLRRQDGTIEYLYEGGVALGVLPDAEYEDRPVVLRPEDVLVLYTDGVTEAVSPEGEQFGQTRLEGLLARLADRPAASIVDGIVAAITEWCASAGMTDDLTLMVVKVKPEESSAEPAPPPAPPERGRGS